MERLVSLTGLFVKFITFDYLAKENIKETIYQLIAHFLLACIERGHYLLVDVKWYFIPEWSVK